MAGKRGAAPSRKKPRKQAGNGTAAQQDLSNYRSIPALAAYIDGVGAEQRNFRRFVIKREGRDRYHHDAVIIKIVEGAIECSDPELAPNPDEAAKIVKALAKVSWPKSIPATKPLVEELRTQLRQKHGDDPTLFVFFDERGERVLFVQQRIYDEAGEKHDLPWSYWSPGGWLIMEPDGDLPLFGLETLRNTARVFLHEGAKTAQFVQWMLAGPTGSFAAVGAHRTHPWLSEFPWIEDLRHAAHLGWPGGAPNSHRVDWRSIRKLPPHISVVIVCDNDQAGQNAAPAISRELQRRCSVVRFRGEFPPSFDLADRFPDQFWREKNGSRVYVGPRLEDCLSPATWATRNVGSAKKPQYVLRDEFVAEWYFTITPDVFMHCDRLHRRYSPEEFNTLVAPYSDVSDVARLLRRKPSAQADELVYEPAQKTGPIALDRKQVINVFQPSPIQPVAGEYGPWLEFMAYLIPDEQDREHLLDWCATLIAQPDVRMIYGVLLISETQGVGKTTLAEILAQLVGLANTVRPRPREVTGEGFTSWLAFKRLAIIPELYDGHTSKTYNRLKTIITDEFVRVEEKYEKAFDLRNWVHVIASSNSFRALKFDQADRRWFVPGVTEEKRAPAEWREFHAWLKNGGLAVIAHWASERAKDESHVVAAGSPAPTSTAKLRTIREAMSDGEKLVADFGDLIAARDEKAVVRIDHTRACLAKRKAARPKQFGLDGKLFLELPETIASVLRGCGLKGIRKQFKEPGGKFSVMANFDIPKEATWPDLRPLCINPADFMEFMEAEDDLM